MPDVSLGLAGSFGHGRVITELLSPDDPAAGDNWSYQLDGSYWERPVSLTFTLVADDTEGDRFVQLKYFDSNQQAIAVSYAVAAQAANAIVTYSFLPNISQPVAVVDSQALAPLPVMFLQPTWIVNVVIDGADAGDEIVNIRYYRERFITGPGGYEIGVQQNETPAEHAIQMLVAALA